jgi:hypothetical protein
MDEYREKAKKMIQEELAEKKAALEKIKDADDVIAHLCKTYHLKVTNEIIEEN